MLLFFKSVLIKLATQRKLFLVHCFNHTFGTLILEYVPIFRSVVSYGTISLLRICPQVCKVLATNMYVFNNICTLLCIVYVIVERRCSYSSSSRRFIHHISVTVTSPFPLCCSFKWIAKRNSKFYYGNYCVPSDLVILVIRVNGKNS